MENLDREMEIIKNLPNGNSSTTNGKFKNSLDETKSGSETVLERVGGPGD